MGPYRSYLKKFSEYIFKNKVVSMNTLLSELHKSGFEKIQYTGEALQRFVHNDFTTEEKEWFKAIELLRKKLCNEPTVVEMIDYGAIGDQVQGKIRKRRINEICRSSSKSARWCKLLFSLVTQLKPECILEFGTSLGISGAYLAAAATLNRKGRLLTLEGDTTIAETARNHFKNLRLTNIEVIEGKFAESLLQLREQGIKADLVFVDGNHTFNGTLEIFKALSKSVVSDGIIVFDDICWSDEMQRAWNIIRFSEGVVFSIDMFEIGICYYNYNMNFYNNGFNSSLWL